MTELRTSIALHGVHRVHGVGASAVTALRGVSLECMVGRFHAVLGPSGSGKSTLLHLAGALDRPSSGRVEIQGQDLSTLDDAGLSTLRRTTIGFVFQSFNLLPSLSVEENALLPLMLERRVTTVDEQRLSSLLERFGLAARRRHLPEQLSGGERQRAALVRALLPRPPILLADEPTGSLDWTNGEGIAAALAELAREDGVCVVAVTHDDRVAALADVVIRLRDGVVESVREGVEA